MATPYERGRRFESRCRDELRDMGFFVLRSAGSKTKVDLAAFAPGRVILVQCKLKMALFPAREQAELRRITERLYTDGMLACMMRSRGPINWLMLGKGGTLENIDAAALAALATAEQREELTDLFQPRKGGGTMVTKYGMLDAHYFQFECELNGERVEGRCPRGNDVQGWADLGPVDDDGKIISVSGERWWGDVVFRNVRPVESRGFLVTHLIDEFYTLRERVAQLRLDFDAA